MNTKKLITSGIMAMAAMCATAVPTVSNETAKQRFPWNGLVDITCTVSGFDGTTQWEFSVDAVMLDSGKVRKVSQFWVVKNGVNSTDKKVRANGTYKLLWDAQADLGAVIYSNMVMRVTIDHAKVQLWRGGPYWAETNIGANNPEDRGYYFWWGDTVGYKWENSAWVATDGSLSNFSFSPSNTPTYDKSIAKLKNEGWITAAGVLAPEHDAAQEQWGGNWRMPTDEELSGLNSRCTWYWMTTNGVQGYLVSGKGDYVSKSIFLCVAGWGGLTSHNDAGSRCNSWSSVPSGSCYAWGLDADNRYIRMHDKSRHLGLPVRPVQGFTE